MKKQRVLSKILATAAFSTVAILQSFGQLSQNNLGQACGCPAVNTRPNVNLSTLPGFVAGELTTGATLSCLNNYILDQKIYVPSGQTINIAPGTVIKGASAGTPADATALIIERGAKINAAGSSDCPIVFTAAADLLDGAYPIANKGQWGGLVILGKAANNLTLAANGPFGPGKLAVANGLGAIEGFSNDSKIYFGVDQSSGAFDNDDNSGILKYVSIRFAGANVQVGNEINALTLGSVGKNTVVEHVEVVSCADDGIEVFGGNVNIKYASILFGNDDMFDWDLGYTGKVQFLFGLKTDNTASLDADNGFEADSDDQKSNNLPASHPVIFNATIIGNNKTVLTSDNSSIAAINAKEKTEGEISNSVFANFKNGLNLVQALGTRPGTVEAYHNWAAASGINTLKIKCNTFVGVTNNLTIGSTPATLPADLTQFTTTDLNVTTASVTGFNFALTINNNTNVITAPSPDATPNPALSTAGCPVAPVDGFFIPAAYRGAFNPATKNWLSEWSYAAAIKAAQGSQPCPTDINGDGSTTAADLNLLVPQFGQQCK